MGGREWRKKKTYDFSVKEFVERFGMSGKEMFLSKIGLIDIKNALPEKERRIVEMFGGCNMEQLKQLEKIAEEMRSKEKNKDNVIDGKEETNTSENDEEEFVFEGELSFGGDLFGDVIVFDEGDIFGVDNSGIVKYKKKSEDEGENARKEKTVQERVVSKVNKAKGEWGEEQAEEILKQKYYEYEVKRYCGTNKGYDYAIVKDGEEVKFVEVKTVDDRHRIPITPSEWNKAKIEREKFEILEIETTSGKYYYLDNPYQLYLDDKINIEVNGIIIK